jgi:hypothetical protein
MRFQEQGVIAALVSQPIFNYLNWQYWLGENHGRSELQVDKPERELGLQEVDF